jgi:hypothetical protein
MTTLCWWLILQILSFPYCRKVGDRLPKLKNVTCHFYHLPRVSRSINWIVVSTPTLDSEVASVNVYWKFSYCSTEVWGWMAASSKTGPTSQLCNYVHRHNLANNMVEGGGAKGPSILGTLIYKGLKLERGGDWFEPVLNVHTPFPHPHPNFFICPSSTR